MGWIERLLRREEQTVERVLSAKERAVAVASGEYDVTMAYTNRNISPMGYLKGYDYDVLLSNKQSHENLKKLFQLSDYYTDADEIIRGIVKEAYLPFACADRWKLVGADEKVKQRYEAYYRRIGLEAFERSYFLQYFKYANVYCYLMPGGRLMTLPVHLVRIADVAINGEPVLEFCCEAIRLSLCDQYGTEALKQFIEDRSLESKLGAFPPEVAQGVASGRAWVQLDPDRTFVGQEPKEEWVKYSTPFICSCLKALAKKALISDYEDSRLRNGARGFVLATYGDPKNQVLPTREDLEAVGGIIRKALSGCAYAVGNNYLDAKWIESNMRDLFEFDVYKNVNQSLLSAGGLSSIVVTGVSGAGSSFATANLNVQTAALRIKNAKDCFAAMMNKVNARINEMGDGFSKTSPSKIPTFTFPPTDLQGSKAFQETCMRLWEKGLLSRESVMNAYGMDLKQEQERRKSEQKAGLDALFVPAGEKREAPEDKRPNGRPTLEDWERKSDKGNSVTGRQPKPSNPAGSEEQA